jgi:hypothetical protein
MVYIAIENRNIIRVVAFYSLWNFFIFALYIFAHNEQNKSKEEIIADNCSCFVCG